MLHSRALYSANAFRLSGLALLALTSQIAMAQNKTVEECTAIADRTARYACYDQLERPKAVIPAGATQSTIPARLPSPAAAATSTEAAGSKGTSASLVTEAEKPKKAPFYKRILGLGDDDEEPKSAPAPATATAAAPKTGVDAFGFKSQSAKVEESKGVQTLTDTIASLKQNAAHMWVITLSSGQVWRQMYTQNYNLEAGDKVKIYPSGWGDAYRLTTERLGSFIQVQRIE